MVWELRLGPVCLMVGVPTVPNSTRCARRLRPRAAAIRLAGSVTALLAMYLAATLVSELLGTVAPSAIQSAQAQSRAERKAARQAQRQAERAQRQAERAQRQAERAQRQAERAQRQAARAQRQAERAQRQAEQAQQSQSPTPGQETFRVERQQARKEKRQERREERREAKKEKRRERRRERRDAVENEAPPATVVEFFKRLVQPEPSSEPQDNVQPDAKTAAKRSAEAEPSRRRKRTRSQRGGANIALPSADSTFKQDEVLASNLNERDLDRARKLGFRVESAGHFATLNSTITRLITPQGLDAVGARDLLRRKLPGGQLALNRYYRVYRTARGDDQSGQNGRLRKQLPSRTRCTGDQCYGLSLIRWRPSLSDCTRSAKIGVIDTPIDHRHPAIIGKNVQVGTFVTGRRKRSADWHGTGVLALLTGDASTTTPGLIPHASFYVADVFSEDAAGVPVAESLSLIQAFEWMDAFGVKIINLSLAGPKDPLVEDVIARLSKRGVIFIAAAGNDGPTAPPKYPAAYAPVITVTAVNKRLRNYRYANRGRHIDFAAPGVGIWTAAPGRKEGYRSGTSFAVPFVTAVAATHYRQLAKPTKSSLLEVIATKDLGPRGHDQIYGRGLIQAPATCGGREPEPRGAPAVVADRMSAR